MMCLVPGRSVIAARLFPPLRFDVFHAAERDAVPRAMAGAFANAYRHELRPSP
jgi:hypothetical protein